MKFTKRESLLLKLLGFVAIIALSYYFVIAPQLEKLANVDMELTEKNLEAESIKQEIESLPQLEEEIDILSDRIQGLSENFFPELEQSKLIIILDEQLRASGAEADSLQFSQLEDIDTSILISTEDNNQDESQSDEVNTDLDQSTAFSEIKSVSIDVPFLGTFQQIMNFINRLENMDRYIIFNNLQMSQETDGNIRGIINLNIYSLDKLVHDSKDEDYLSWPYNTPTGTNNPFRFIPSSAEEAIDDESIVEDDNTLEEPEGDNTSEDN
jgi:type IV pilus assembly protein PilO